MFDVILLSKPRKYYQKCNKNTVEKLNRCFENMESDPFSNTDTKPLYGKFKGLYRVRIADIRVIFKVDYIEKIVYIMSILPRGDVYK